MRNVEMSLLFPTRFSESCFQAIPAVAQWMDDVSCSLTITHVYHPRNTNMFEAEAQLRSFFAEADRYPNTRRVLLSGEDAAGVLAEYLGGHRHDLVVAPASDRVGLPRPFHRSTRAHLLAHSDTAVWTMGTAMDSRVFRRPARVGCMISRRSDSRRPLDLACEYALRVGATLQLLYLVPEVHEGMLRNAVGYDEPLTAMVALEDLQRIAATLPVTPELHSVVGSDAQRVLGLLRNSRTDILFVGKHAAAHRSLFRDEMNRFVDVAECPVVCVDQDRALPLWALRKPVVQPQAAALVATAS